MTRETAERRKPRNGRRLAAVVLGFVGVVGLGIGSAAQVNLGSDALGAGSTTVASCQPVGQVISVSFTSTYVTGAYRASAVTVSNVNGACGGQKYRIRVLDAAGTALGSEVFGTVPTGAGPFTLTGSLGATAQPVTSIASVAIVIHA